MSEPPTAAPLQVFVVDPEPPVAQAIAALALEALPASADTIVARAHTVEGAKRLLERVSPDDATVVIVVCASELADGMGLDVLNHARSHHPLARVVLLTNGEREGFLTGIRTRVDGVVSRADALRALRGIIGYLGREPAPPVPQVATREGVRFEQAVEALHRALEAVERAHDQLRRASDETSVTARRALAEAEILAVKAHRRVLDAERELASAAPEAQSLQRSQS
ncbi:MAG TPA: hypothetical protein VM582_06355 [Candidatus Thermoplasmatota archaeon]|nr:hypothetical protein [Candidatus Thermoplasmatota archaeon]